MRPLHFWLTAAGTAALIGALVALFFPFGPLGIETAAERQRAWLLTVWTAGVMAVCFGAAGLLSAVAPIGFRDVAEAGSVLDAIDARREARKRQDAHNFYNFAGWTVSTGGMLLILYFAGWIVTAR